MLRTSFVRTPPAVLSSVAVTRPTGTELSSSTGPTVTSSPERSSHRLSASSVPPCRPCSSSSFRVRPALAAVLALHVRQANEGLLGFAVSRPPAFPSLSANVRLQLSSSSCAWTPGSPRTSCSQGSPFLPAGVRLALGPPWNEVASTFASRRFQPARTRGLLQLRGYCCLSRRAGFS